MSESPIRVERGATGFWDRRTGPLPTLDPARVRQACWAAAAPMRATTSDVSPGYPASFTCTELRASDGRLTAVVVAHLHLPLITLACVPPAFGGPPTAIVPQPAWAEVFEAFDFAVLDDAMLRTPLAQVDLSALPAVEREQARQWKPATLGDLLFNWWD